ncbi:MAG: hypothetical protein KGP01_02770 [Actinomycetales bacterium]|nr:hypothetical protein [Actinomycetales bacterium]
MTRRLLATAVVLGSALLGSVGPASATTWDGEDRGEPLSLLQVIGLFVGVPAAVIGLIYFIAFVPKRKSGRGPSTDIVIR